jgi:hypothetical protein
MTRSWLVALAAVVGLALSWLGSRMEYRAMPLTISGEVFYNPHECLIFVGRDMLGDRSRKYELWLARVQAFFGSALSVSDRKRQLVVIRIAKEGVSTTIKNLPVGAFNVVDGIIVASFGVGQVQQWDSALHDFRDATSEQSWAFSRRSYPMNIQMREGWSRRAGLLVSGHPIEVQTSIEGKPLTLLFQESGPKRTVERILLRDAKGEKELLQIDETPRVVRPAEYEALFDEVR